MNTYKVLYTNGMHTEVQGHSFVYEKQGMLEIKDEADETLHVFDKGAWASIVTIVPEK